MGGPQSAVTLDISSDEEPGVGGGDRGFDDFNWITELFKDEDDDNVAYEESFEIGDADDSDDLVLVGEVSANSKQRINDSSTTVEKAPKGLEDNDDDDDCIVLDGDPDKPAAVENGRTGSENDSGDDLVVVSEKGQVACRDYPHPRHLCVKFPFNSTQHELHCDQCHCYVCDSLAPCVHWGNCVSIIGHCHATDKDEFWKAQRRSMRCAEAPLPAPMVNETARSMSPATINQAPPLSPNLVLHNQVVRQAAIHPYSMPTDHSMLNVIRLGRSHQPGNIVSRSRVQPQLISQHVSDANIHVSLRDRRLNSGNMGSQSMSSRVSFKRTGAVGSALASDRIRYNQFPLTYGSRSSSNPPSTVRRQGSHGGVPPVSNAYHDAHSQNGQSANVMTYQSGLNIGNGFSRTVPHEILSQQHLSGGYANFMPFQSHRASLQHNSRGYANHVAQMSSHHQVDGSSTNSVPPQPHVPLQTIEDGAYGNSSIFEAAMTTQPQGASLSEKNAGRGSEYSEACQPQPFSQFEADKAFQNSVPSEFTTSSLPHLGSSSENLPFTHQPQEYSQRTSIQYSSQTCVQQENHAQEALGSNAAVSASRCVTNTNPSSQQPGINNPQLQSAEPTGNFSANIMFQCNGSTDFGPSNAMFDNWFFEDQGVSGALEVPAQCQLNTYSPDFSLMDGGLFPDL